ncbi:MAG: FtsW/RodA/SpoVE family cell cycle protein [Planctomycetota bacterium]
MKPSASVSDAAPASAPTYRGSIAASAKPIDPPKPTNVATLSVIAALGLCLIGVYAIDLGESAAPSSLSRTATRQCVYIAVGLIAAIAVVIPSPRLLRRLAWPGFLGCIGLLVFLLVPFVPESIVTPRNGARGWINFGVADFQPAEVTKIAFVLVIAGYLRFRTEHRTFRGLLPLGLVTFVPVALITLQPDLGTSSLFIPALFAMLVAAGARLRHLALIVAMAALAAPAVYPVLKPHQKQRFVALFRQIQGDRTTAYDINFQSFTAQTLVGAGRIEGVPDVKARALVRYSRLPEAHNDMVFAVIVTRFGFAGGLVVLALFGLWVVGALVTAAQSREPQHRLICVGCAGFIVAQMFINVGMTVGLLPIIGITLPFVSFGGSSMLTCWLMTGLVMHAAVRRPRGPMRPSFEFDE